MSSADRRPFFEAPSRMVPRRLRRARRPRRARCTSRSSTTAASPSSASRSTRFRERPERARRKTRRAARRAERDDGPSKQRVRAARPGRASGHVGAVSEQRRGESPRLLVLRTESVRAPALQGQRASAAAVRQTGPRRARLQHPRRHARLHPRRRHAVLRPHRPQRHARARVAAGGRLHAACLDAAHEARRPARDADADARPPRTT